MDRRDFIKASCALCAMGAIVYSMESCSKDSTAPKNVNFSLDLTSSSNAALNTVGGYIIQNSVIVIRLNSTDYIALSAVCTHQGCTVSYDKTNTRLSCPCHGGTYNTNGAVTGGPPPSALAKYNVTKNGNTLTITS